MKEEEILGILPLHIRTIIKQAGINWNELQEIRLRIQKPVILKYNAKTCYLSEQGKITTRKEQLHIVTSQEIRQAMEYISSYSMYAYIEQLKQGFLTIRGGHRVGICGTVVMDHDKVKTIRHISGLNIRVAHEVKGCADTLYSRCTRMGKLIPTLIISPPLFLAQKSTDATKADQQVVVDLLDTLRANLDHCVGMAANMIGVKKNIIVVAVGPFQFAMINPKITKRSGVFETEEGCLSLDGVRPCKRYKEIEVDYLDQDFKEQHGKYSGWTAQIIQHEIDHCKGIVI